MSEKVIGLMNSLTDKEADALTSAVTVLANRESSKEDCISGLWGVVVAIAGDSVGEDGIDVKDVLRVVDPCMVD